MTKIRQWSILTAVAVAAILVAGWFLLVSPKRGEAADLRAQTATQEQQNEQLRTQLAMLKAQQTKLPAQRVRLAEITAKLPRDQALPALVRSLTDAAWHSGVDIVSMAPGQPTTVSATATGGSTGTTAGSGTSSGAASGTANVGQLAWIPVTLQAHGGYFQLEGFVNRLETLRRAYLVTGITLAPGPKLQPGTATGEVAGAAGDTAWTGNLVATLTGRVFMVATGSAPAAAQPSASASAQPSASAAR